MMLSLGVSKHRTMRGIERYSRAWQDSSTSLRGVSPKKCVSSMKLSPLASPRGDEPLTGTHRRTEPLR